MDAFQDAINRVKDLFSQGKYDAAENFLQECIYQWRVETLKAMEELRDSTEDKEVMDRLVSLYFFNYV